LETAQSNLRQSKSILNLSSLFKLKQFILSINSKGPSKEEWDVIVDEFKKEWDFPNCLGAIDGKHVKIQAPANSGSVFFNYKNYFSLVLLGTCDAQYRFTTIDIGAYGRQSDGGIFEASKLGKSIEDGTDREFNSHVRFGNFNFKYSTISRYDEPTKE